MILGATIALMMAQAAGAPAAQPNAAPQPPAAITRAQIQAQAKAVFDRVDANKDGKVDRAEADRVRAAALAQLKTRREQAQAEAFGKLDTNKDGNISRQEFSAATAPKDPQDNWFTSNDTDKNGAVVLSEMTAVAMREFDSFDTDRNGTVTAAEQQAARARLASR